ncbi:MAG: hypothetical protein CME65_12265 [Halobacteriovoraceae bacterium]|nr:hypothetical protein [Halobacteriovoraceae bacterium]|tara:strand:- start:6827 stop:7474 length:648 start_codon:yes stop_codon:yes gene_type:complete
MKEFAQNYFELLNGKYAGINLTRITEPEEFWNKQILDSIEPFYQSKTFQNSINESSLHIDVGFGGGFPLLPLAFLNPQKEFIGIEARAKKAKVVDEIALELGLNNVNCHHIRLENLLIDVPCSITLKAVGKVYDFLSLINAKNKVKVFFYKGPNFTNIEAAQIKRAKSEWSVIEDLEIDVQGTEKRYIIGFENKNVPHGTTNKKGLLSLASLKKA